MLRLICRDNVIATVSLVVVEVCGTRHDCGLNNIGLIREMLCHFNLWTKVVRRVCDIQ